MQEFLGEAIGMYVFALAVFAATKSSFRIWWCTLAYCIGHAIAMHFHGAHFNLAISAVGLVSGSMSLARFAARIIVDVLAAWLAYATISRLNYGR